MGSKRVPRSGSPRGAGLTGWQGDFGSSQAHQLTLGGSQAGSFAAHPRSRGLQQPPLLLLLGSVHPQGCSVAKVRLPGVCKALRGCLPTAAGPHMSLGVPALLGVSCSSSCIWRSWGGPCITSTPPPSFCRQRALKMCSNSILSYKNWGKRQSEAFQQQAQLQLLASLTAPCSVIIQINLFQAPLPHSSSSLYCQTARLKQPPGKGAGWDALPHPSSISFHPRENSGDTGPLPPAGRLARP